MSGLSSRLVGSRALVVDRRVHLHDEAEQVRSALT